MKKLTHALVFLVVAAPAVSKESLTYEEYRKEVGAGQERLDYSKGLLRHDELHRLVPELQEDRCQGRRCQPGAGKGAAALEEGPGSFNVGEVPGKEGSEVSRSTETAGPVDPADPEASTAPESADEAAAAPVESDRKPEPSSSPARKQPASTSGGGTAAGYSSGIQYIATERSNRANVVRPKGGKKVTFGIPVGAEIPIRLDESATNIQPGLIVLTVEKTVRGRKNTLPVGSQLFSRSSAVIGSDSLFMRVSHGITPDGDEFSMSGTVFNDNREPGFAGRVVSDGKTLARATSEGTNAFAQGLLGSVPLEGVGGAAAEAGASQVLKEKQREDSARQGRPAYVVEALPQTGFVQVERTF